MCIVLVGQINDAILRMESFKRNNGRTKEQENELIMKNCFHLMYIMFQYIDHFNINITKVFPKMLSEAWYYIKNNDTLNVGFHSENSRREIVEKRINKKKIIELGYGYDSSNLKRYLDDYIRQLEFRKIKVSKPIYIQEHGDDLVIIQPYIRGMRLDECLITYSKSKKYYGLLQEIFKDIFEDLIFLYRENRDIRVDNNLSNFIIEFSENKHSINLVDVYPPILLSKMKCIDKTNIIFYLTTDIKISLMAFLYYYIRIMVRNSKLIDLEGQCDFKDFVGELICYVNEKLKDDNALKHDNEVKKDIYKYFEDKIHYMYNSFGLSEKKRNEAFREIEKWSIRKEVGLGNDL